MTAPDKPAGGGTAGTAPGPVQLGDLDAIVAALQTYRYTYSDEAELQVAVATALSAAGLPAEREVRLAPGDRLDILSGPVAVEVKVSGAVGPVLRQLQRYARHPRVRGLVLVTTRARHNQLPELVHDKPLRVVRLGGAA